MQVFDIAISPALAAKYQGSGYAIGAVIGDHLIDFKYLRDALPDFEGDYSEGGHGHELAMASLSDQRLGPVVREMQSLGDVVVGMCSCLEFVVV
jgi:hypothetical protein